MQLIHILHWIFPRKVDRQILSVVRGAHMNGFNSTVAPPQGHQADMDRLNGIPGRA
jgi:hypothetical protein